jgi:hypothetical protein
MMARVPSAQVRWTTAAAFSTALLLGASAIGSPAAAAQPACGPHTEVIKALGDKFRETQSATALTNAGTLLEVLTSNDGSTWTIIVSRPDGLSCVVAAGQN